LALDPDPLPDPELDPCSPIPEPDPDPLEPEDDPEPLLGPPDPDDPGSMPELDPISLPPVVTSGPPPSLPDPAWVPSKSPHARAIDAMVDTTLVLTTHRAIRSA